MEMERQEIDKKLSNLHNYTGTQNYYDTGKLFNNILLTDGIRYVAENGYSWLITDILANITANRKIREYLQRDYFLSITLKVNLEQHTAELIFTDGNDNEIYRQRYGYTDAEVSEIKMYYCDGVLMLSSEY